MIHRVARALLPDAAIRIDAAAHPYTVDGREVHANVSCSAGADVSCSAGGDVDGKWVEILECGLVLPALLAEAGWNTDHYSGLAMGMGLDRILMIRKGIEDIRLLRSTDERMAAQMLDLSRYQPVSRQPSIQRDMSIAVEPEVTPEELGDRVRALLGERASSIETVTVLSETAYAGLPPAARSRLGMAPHQKNVLLRVVIRDLSRTLSSQQANALRDTIYQGLHAGSVHTWASTQKQ